MDETQKGKTVRNQKGSPEKSNVIHMEPDYHPDCEGQICAALVREIGRSDTTWAARVDAWEALLTVRRDGQAMADEARGFAEQDMDTTQPDHG